MNISPQLSPTAHRLMAAESIAIPPRKQLLRRLFWIYVAGGSAGVGVTFLSFVRISLPHAFGAATTGLFAMLLGNWLLDSQFALWQIAIFNATILLFAVRLRNKLSYLTVMDGVWTMTEK